MSKKILISAGGTGGHIYPALSLASQLKDAGQEVLFCGGNLEENRYFDKEAFPYRSVKCGTFLSKNLWQAAKSGWTIVQGILQSRQHIKAFNPHVVVGFGSFYTFPTLLAAQSLGIPIILHEANSIPGKVNRLLAPYVEATGVHFPETIKLLKGKSIEVGMPLREGFKKGIKTKEEACAYFGLQAALPTLLIFGGSQGAKAINQLASEALLTYFQGEIQVIHITGAATAAAELREAYQNKGIVAYVKDFELKMDLAWQAADLMISRAGAGTIAEELEYEVPGILIPYPHAADFHQEKNAEFMASTVGGAIKVLEKGLSAKLLAHKLELLLQNDLESLRHEMRAYKLKKRQMNLCHLVLQNVGEYA